LIAFGYVRLDDEDDAAVEALHDLITAFGAAEGYSVEEIYIDRRTGPSSLVRPGFQALTDGLERADAAHVLVPDLDHLSPLPAVRTALEAKLGSLGSTVVSVH
jgi:hypothetical protein